jgi:hypothetical protein
MRRVVILIFVGAVSGTGTLAAPAEAAVGKASVAALQVALRSKGIYHASIDGILSPRTRRAVRRLQRRAGLTADGVVGPRTRRVLGRLGRPKVGSRTLRRGAVGWDVSALQFALAWHGFPSGPFDGVFGPRTQGALRRFQRSAHLPIDGVAGPLTLKRLRSARPSCPLALRWPVNAEVSSPFGPRGDGFHAGLDLAAPRGTEVRAAASGIVTFAGRNDGFGKFVVVRHRLGVRTFYAHLSRLAVHRGRRVGVGSVVGRVGSTGRTTGPHLHFEVRVRGAAVDPLKALR